MAWTKMDAMNYDGLKEIVLLKDENDNLMLVAEVGLEKVSVATEGTYLSFSIDGDKTRFYARSVPNPKGNDPFKIYKEYRS